MKTIIIFVLIGLIAYFINIGMQLAWHYSLLEGVKFRIQTDWLPWHILAGMPPVVLFYGALGWVLCRYYPNFEFREVTLFISIVLAWKLIFIQEIWHLDPSIANLTWSSIEFVLPCIAVLIGYQLTKLRSKYAKNA